MPAGYTLSFDGAPMDDTLAGALSSLEVEENADLPGAISLVFTVSGDGNGDYDVPNNGSLTPFTNVSVVAAPENAGAQCIFDGVILSHRLHVDSGTTSSTLSVWGQDTSWRMNLTETVREWVDVTDGSVANQIFDEYGISGSDDNLQDDSPERTEDSHSLMQRATDIQFLRMLARRSGKLCRVVSRDQPGQYVGIFARPKLDGEPVATLTLNDPVSRNTEALAFSWDITSPSEVIAAQALFDDNTPEGATADTTSSGLATLDERDLSTFAGQTMTVLLTAPLDDAGELTLRSEGVLVDGGWFVRCEGETEVERLGVVLRVGDLVQIEGVGTLNSGTYLVWSVHHSIQPTSHVMRFVLYRNAIGPAASGGGGLLGGLL